MSEEWKTIKAQDVQVGDAVRTRSGDVMTVSRIETSFLDRANMIAFIEDTDERWFKQPMMADGDAEVRQEA